MGEGIVCLREQATLQFAGEELARLSRQYGKPLQGSFVLGTWEDCAAAGISLEALTDRTDGRRGGGDAYGMTPYNDGILLSGRTERAVLFAVYDYAREQWGAHYPFPDQAGEAPHGQPIAGTGALTEARYAEPLFSRRGFVIENVYDADFLLHMIDWLAKNRVSELFLTFMLFDSLRDVIEPELAKRGMTLTLGGHSMRFFLNDEKHAVSEAAQDNPYHSKWQFDYTDASWQDDFCRRIASYCAGVPLLRRVSLWPEDVGVNSEGGTAFLSGYLRFTERLQRQLAEAKVNAEVEHIAYNAGLSWDMLERKGSEASESIDTLFAYWGRDYSRSYTSSDEAGARAYAGLQDWRTATRAKGRELTIFEYYSDHFMMSWLFPVLAERIEADLLDYKRLGIDGIVDLIVPYVPKKSKPEGTVPPLDAYDWKWIHGYNSFIFARLTWGGSLEQAREEYLSAYAPAERDAVRRLLAAIERTAAPLTAWNVPLFPARAADPEQVEEGAFIERVANMLQNVARLAEELPALTEKSTPAMRKFHAYVSGLAHWSGVLESEWRAKATPS